VDVNFKRLVHFLQTPSWCAIVNCTTDEVFCGRKDLTLSEKKKKSFQLSHLGVVVLDFLVSFTLLNLSTLAQHPCFGLAIFSLQFSVHQTEESPNSGSQHSTHSFIVKAKSEASA